MSETAGGKSLASPKVSVITPLYNSAAFIRGTLDSLLAQSYANWESVLVDDGSTDETAEVVRPYLEDPRFRYVRQENQGIAGARNTGVRAATGEWICLLDHDDRWLPDKLERQVRHALEKGCDIVCTDAFIVEPARRWINSEGFPEVAAKLRQGESGEDVDTFALLIRANFICTCSVMARRSLFDARGLFDPEAAPADDYDMWLRCMPEAKIGFVDEPLVEYVVHEGNYSRNEARMLGKIARVLRHHQGLHATERARARQFDEALVIQHEYVYRKWMERGSYGQLLRHSLPLLAGGRASARLFASAALVPFVSRLANSIRYRLGLARTQ